MRADKEFNGYTIAKGGYPGVSVMHKFGYSEAINTTFSTVWEQGGLYQYMATPSIVKISSTNANDAAAGTGARTIQIFGLDANGLEIDETITMNGQTAVNSVKTYSYVYRALVLTAGSGAVAAGIIRVGTGTVTAGVPAVVHAYLDGAENQTQQCAYKIPSNKTGHLRAVYASVGAAKEIEGVIVVRSPGGVFRQISNAFLFQTAVNLQYDIPIKLSSGTEIELRAKSASGTVSIACAFTLILEEN